MYLWYPERRFDIGDCLGSQGLFSHYCVCKPIIGVGLHRSLQLHVMSILWKCFCSSFISKSHVHDKLQPILIYSGGFDIVSEYSTIEINVYTVIKKVACRKIILCNALILQSQMCSHCQLHVVAWFRVWSLMIVRDSERLYRYCIGGS